MIKEPAPPRGAGVVIVLFCSAMGIFGCLLALFSPREPHDLALISLSWATGLGAVAAVRAFFVQRSARRLSVRADGGVSIVSPLSFWFPLLAGWLLAMAMMVLLGWVFVTSPEALDQERRAGAAFAAMLFTLPNFARLLTGRFHRWRLDLDPDSLTYRGCRTDRTVPWSAIRRVKITYDKPVQVVVVTRTSREPDIVIPFFCFDLPAQQFVDEIESRIRAHRGHGLGSGRAV